MSTPVEGLDSVEVGKTVRFRKTVGETDVYQFAGITGDFSPNHVDEEYMKETHYGRRIAHGALLVGYMSTASTRVLESIPYPCVSYGYDRIRFIRPVFIGDTITVEYRVCEKLPAKAQLLSEVVVTNQHDDVVAAGTHIMKFV